MREAYREKFEDADFGGFLAAVIAASVDRGEAWDRRLEFQSIAGLGSDFPTEGGFLIPDSHATDLWTVVNNQGAILRRCTRQPVTVGDKIHIPAVDEISRADGSRFGTVRCYWSGEGDLVTATKMKTARITLQPHKLLSLAYATNGLAGDVPALAVWLRRVFGLEASFTIEDQITNGDGLGKPLGVMKSGALITVSAESGQAAATILPANLANMAARLWGPSHRSAVWLMSTELFGQVATASFANGSPVVETGPNGERLILQMPVELVEYTSAAGELGDVLLCDFSQYLIAEKDSEFISSVHISFLSDESAFRLRYRVDGQSAWRAPMTPRNGTATQSPFVALGIRNS